MKKLNKIQEGPYEIKQKSKNTETESSISSHKISRSNVINPITVALLKSQKKKMSLIGFTFYDRNYAKQIMYQFRKNLVFIFMIIFIRDCLNIYFTYIRSQNNELKYNHEMDDNVNKIGLSLNQTYLHQNRTNRVGAKIRQPTYNYNIYLVIFIFVSNMLLFIVIYILSHVKRVSGNYMSTLITATIILLGYSSLTTFIIYGSESSIIPHTFISVTSSIIMIYSLMPLKFITTFLISLFITLSYNFINILVTLKYDENNFKIKYVYLHLNQVIGECVLQMCLHLLGIYIFCNSKKRRVATHKNIKKSIDMQNELEMENNRYKKLIYSFIPIRFANMILSSKFKEDENIDVPKKFNKFNKFTRFFYRKKPYNKKKVTKLSIQYSEYLKLDDEKFEKLKAFSIEKMNNVSILFADIVGFTKMSSTKTAHTIVELLNFLFHKFDDLCESNNCEKIGTIGDCYYAVSGCPEPCENHAKNCIEFGLGMIEIIREFDEKYNENVKMRIGVHSGSILCGIVGTTRFKFDIWSNDVTIANRLESDGIANMIHISNMTAQLVNGQYNLIDGKSMEYVYKRTLVEKYIDGRFVSQIKNEKKHFKTYFIELKYIKRLRTIKPSLRTTKLTMESIINICYNDYELLNTHHNYKHRRNAISSRSKLNMNNPLDVRNEEIYFQKVPLNFITLHFKQKYIERLYVKYFAKNLFRINEMKILNNEFCDNKINEPIHQDLLKKESSNMTMKTNAIYKLYKIFLPKFNENTFKDDIPKMKRKLSINWAPLSNIIEHAIIFFVILLIMFCYILNFEYTKLHNVTIILFIFQILCIIICFISSIYEFYYGKMNLYKTKVFNIFFGLWGYNTVSLIIIMFPVLTLMYGYNCSNMIVNNSETLYILLIVVTVVLFIHFNIVTFWTKILAMIVVIFLIIYFMSFDVCKSVIEENKNNNSTIPILQIKNVTMLDYQNITIQNFSIKAIIPILIHSDMYEILKKPIEKYRIMTKDQFFHYPILYFGKINKHNKYIKIQLIVQFTSLLIIVIYINIQCEKLFRQSFYRSLLTLEHQHDIQKRRKYSRILLNKIIPEYVIKEFATKKSYSKDIDNVGIIFASILNYDDLYEECFEKGEYLLQVLNNIFEDFENLLDKPQFKYIEKVKTIGSCFMAASGLNKNELPSNNDIEHLCTLMDFAFEIKKLTDKFNLELFNFQFKIKIGYNVGNVVAGVIGTKKLHYDIWGDAVNLASRMYTSAQNNQIQVPEKVAIQLSSEYYFENKRFVNIKGKGDMLVFNAVSKI